MGITDNNIKPGNRVCKKCTNIKDINEFASCKTCKYNKAHVCKKCMSKHQQNYIKNNHKAKVKRDKRSVKHREENRDLFNLTVRLSNYKKLGINIDKEEYLLLYKQQKGKCKICKLTPKGHKKVLCLDHCHDTMKVRGLLCDNCNMALGKFKDDITLLESAIKYLNR